MADWKEMYLTMTRASEKAIRILIEAQQECEEMYMRDGDGPQEYPPDDETEENPAVMIPWPAKEE